MVIVTKLEAKKTSSLIDRKLESVSQEMNAWHVVLEKHDCSRAVNNESTTIERTERVVLAFVNITSSRNIQSSNGR